MDDKKPSRHSVVLSFAISILICLGICFSMGYADAAMVCVGLAIPNINISQIFSSATDISKKSSLSPGGKDEAKTADTKIKDTASSGSLAYVPDDIAKLIKTAKENASSDKKDGAITELKYGASSATQHSGNIYVRNTTSKTLDIDSELNKKVDLSIKKNEPTILVFHTHTTESYQILDRNFYAQGFTTRSTSSATNMVRIGDEIVSRLESAGYTVLHDTNIYDSTYSGSYERSGKAIDAYLKKYPSIQVILDIHRDAIQNDSGVKTKPVATINGKKAAQLMIISGCQEKDITGFDDWPYNLRFALNLHKTCEDMYPGLMRPLFFCNRKYNMYKSHCSLLIEVGSDANTLDEAAYSGRLLGNALSEMLEKYVEK